MNRHTDTTNGKAPGAINTERLTTDNTNDLNFATGTRHSKAIATQVAHLAIAGHAVHHLADGGYLVCKFVNTHHAQDFEGFEAFALRLGVKQ